MNTDFWVVSQDEEKTINVKDNYMLNTLYNRNIIVANNNCNEEFIMLGEYTSKERAKEVLKDMRQFHQHNLIKYESRDSYIRGNDVFTLNMYMMPKE